MTETEFLLAFVSCFWGILFLLSMFSNLIAIRTIRNLLDKEAFLKRVIKNNSENL